MRYIHTFLLFAFFLLSNNTQAAIGGNISASVTSACSGTLSPKINFEGTGGTVPYTFTYTINGGVEQTVVSDEFGKCSVDVPTGTAGVYVYTLTKITGNESGEEISGLNDSVTVTINQSPDATLKNSYFTIENPYLLNACGSREEFLFSHSSSTSAINTGYRIDWGDNSPIVTSGTYIKNEVSRHEYEAGNYTLLYTVYTAECESTQAYQISLVSIPAVNISKPSNTDICVGTEVEFPFTMPSNEEGTTYTIAFGDGEAVVLTSLGSSIKHTYQASSCGLSSSGYDNTYTFTIIATNRCGSATGTVAPIYVSSPPAAQIEADRDKACINTPVVIRNISDGGTAITINPSGGTTCITNTKPVWKISPSTYTGVTEDQLGTDLSSQNPRDWLTGENEIVPYFTEPGIYTITMKIGNKCGVRETSTTVCVEKLNDPTFILSQDTACLPFIVAINNTTEVAQPICEDITYNWNIDYVASNCGTGSGYTYVSGSAASEEPSIRFDEAGTYEISLTTENTCPPKTSVVQNVVVKDKPKVTINTIPSICQTFPLTTLLPTVTPNNCGSDPLTYNWIFTDGTPSSSTEASPSITYSDYGTKAISLSVANECGTSSIATANAVINQSPVMDAVTSQTVCANKNTTAVSFSATPASTYTWTNNNATIGLGTSGSGNIAAFSAKNATALPITGTIVVTPTLTATGCSGETQSFDITVNPLPVVNLSLASEIICSEATTTGSILTSTTPGAVFIWTATAPAGVTGVITSGTGNIPAQTITNITNTFKTITYTVKAYYPDENGCEGVAKTYTIRVNPKPAIADAQVVAICSGSSFSFNPSSIAGNIVPSGTTYTWSAPIVTGGMTGGAAGTNATTISGTLTNPTNTLQTAEYTITPKSGNCTGTPFKVLVPVNPKPKITLPDITICNGETFDATPTNGVNGNILPDGTTYTWTVTSNSNIEGESNVTTPIQTISQTLTNISLTDQTVTYTVTPTSGTCVGTSFSFTVTVKPSPTGSILGDAAVCVNAIQPVITFTGLYGVAPYTFYYRINGGSEQFVVSTGSIATISASTSSVGTFVYSLERVKDNSANICEQNLTGQSVTITVTEKPVIDVITDKEFCIGTLVPLQTITSTGSSSTTYLWTNNNTAIGLSIAGIGNVPSFTTTNTSPNSIIGTIAITPTDNGCIGESRSYNIKVNPSPVVIFSQANQTICSGDASTNVTLQSTTSGVTFSWTAEQPIGITGVITAGTGTIPSQTLVNSTNEAITVVYIAKATEADLSCEGEEYEYHITVNPKASVKKESVTICSGETFTVTPTDGNGNNIPLGTTYIWTSPSISSGITGGVAGNGSSITGILTNTTNVVQTATYTVTPKSGDCFGETFEIEVSVDPKPTITIPAQTICSGASFNVEPVNETNGIVPSGTTYTWTVSSNANILGASPVSTAQDSVGQALTNTSTTVQTIIYTVIPTSGNCQGAAFTITINVNPAPMGTISGSTDICWNAGLTPVTFTGNYGTAPYTFYYTINDGSELSVTGTPDGKAVINAPSSDLGTFVYKLVRVTDGSADACTQEISGQSATINVNEMAILDPIADQTFCDGSQTTLINFTSTGEGASAATYTWVNDNTAIGLAASGTGDIASFTATNTTALPIVGTITVTPSLGACVGQTSSFTITINPSPVVTFSQADQIICSGDATTSITLQSTTPGTTFTWTAVQPTGIMGVTTFGTGIIPVQTLVNSTNAPIPVVYKAKGSSSVTLGCEGPESEYKITVNPKPTIANETTVVCSEGTFAVTPANGTNGNIIASGTTYSWSAPVVTGGITGGAAGSNQTAISGTLINPTNIPQTATYTVTPQTGSCTGESFEVVVTVNPKPNIDTLRQTICSGSSFSIIPINGTDGVVPVSTTYTWTVANNANVTGYSDQGVAQSVISQTLVNSSAVNQVVTYTVTPISGDAGNCVGNTFEVEITILPALSGTISGNDDLCLNASKPTITFTGMNGTAPYTFYYTIDGGADQQVSSVGLSNTATILADTNVLGIHTYILVKVKDAGFNSCEQTISGESVQIVVNEIPTVSTISDKSYCANTSSDEIEISSPTLGSIDFTWSNSNTAIGLSASGNGNNIASFTTANSTANPISGTITVIPTLGGCVGTPSNFVITIDPLPAVTFDKTNQTICSASQTDVVTLESTTTGATFNWIAYQPTGITGAALSGIETIPVQILTNTTTSPITVVYTATAYSSSLGCAGATNNYTITVNPTPVIANETMAICSEGTFTVTPTNGTNGNIIASGTTYSWSAPVVTGGITGGAAGSNQTAISGTLINPTNIPQTATYTVTPQTGSCTGESFEVVVTVNPKPNIDTLRQTICSGSSFSIIPINGTDGVVPVSTTYTWTVANNANVTGYSDQGVAQSVISQTLVNSSAVNQVVTYTVTPTSGDAGNCVGESFTVEITVQSAPTGTIAGTTTVCQNSAEPTITFTGANGTAPYTFYYTINGSSELSVTSIENMATITANTSVVGTHTYSLVRVADASANTCEQILTGQEAIVTVVTPPSISEQPLATQAICTNGQIQALTVAYTGGVGVPNYQWYKNTVDSNFGGIAVSEANISNYTPPAADFSSVGKYYYYAVVTLTGGGCSDITSNTAEIDVASIPPTVTTPPLAEQTICQNTTPTDLQVIVNGGIGSVYFYQWYDENGKITDAISDTYTPSTIAVGVKNYYCEISQTSIGCNTISPNAKVEVTKAPSLTVQPQSSEICEGETATLLQVAYTDGTGSVLYQWYENTVNQYGGTLIAGANDPTFTAPVNEVKTTYYYCILTFTEGGCGTLQSDIAKVMVKQIPVVGNKSFEIGSDVPLSYIPVNGVDGNIVPVGTTYTWTVTSVNPVGGVSGASSQSTPQSSFSQTLTNMTEQAVVVIYTVLPSANGCQGAPFNIEVKLAPSIDANELITHITCYNANNGGITTNIVGGLPPYNITWTGPNGFTANTPNITNLEPGDYTLSITDQGGLPFVKTLTVTQPDEFLLNIADYRQIFCNANTDAYININVSGGTTPYTYSWTKDGNPYANTPNLANLGIGTYVITVDDKNNCGPLTESIQIEEPVAIEISMNEQTNVLCYGASTGSIFINVAGGTTTAGGYTYSWIGSNGFTSDQKDIQSLKAGVYTITVTDELSCIKQENYTITQPDDMTFDIVKTDVSCYDGDDASITINVLGGVAPYTAVWSSYGSGLHQENLSVGDYTVTITDANNCVKVLDINIPQAPIFRITPVVNQISCNGNNDGSIKLNFEGGKPPIQFAWEDNPTAGTERNRLVPGNYTVHIQDSKGCKIDRSFIIIEPSPLQLSAQITNAMDCNNPNTGAINLQITGGTEPYLINWSNGATTKDLINTPPNNYFVNVVDNRGCTVSGQYTVQRPTPINIHLETEQLFDCSSHLATQQITATVIGGVAPYTIEWSAGQVSGSYGQIMQTSQNGAVTVTVTDNVGCSTSKMFDIEIPEYGIKPTLINCNERMYTFDAIVHNGHPSDTYIWNFDDGTTVTGKQQSHQFARSGTYNVSLKVISSVCSYTLSKSIFVERIPAITISPEAKLCPGDSVLITAYGADIYKWIDGSVDDSFMVNTLGTYSVRGTTKNGCFADVTITASYHPLLNYKIQSNTRAITKASPVVELWAQEIDASNFVWDFGDETTAGGNYITHTYDIVEDYVYNVKLYATNPYGCVETDSINIHANKSMEVMPNTFTPNGDGIHDRFMEGWKIEVYNRNGVLLYEGSDGWDGTYKGKPVGSDTYYYIVYDKTADGMKKKSYYVTIIR